MAHGLPAVSIDFGGIEGVGHVQENAGVAARLLKGGHRLLSEKEVLTIVENAILQPTSGQVVTSVKQQAGDHWDCQGDSQFGRDARFLALKHRQSKSQKGAAGKGGDGAGASVADKLGEVASVDEAANVVGELIAAKLASIFMIPLSDIDLTKTSTDYGVDSLVAIELRNMLVRQVATEVSIFTILQSASLAALALDAAAKSAYIQAASLA